MNSNNDASVGAIAANAKQEDNQLLCLEKAINSVSLGNEPKSKRSSWDKASAHYDGELDRATRIAVNVATEFVQGVMSNESDLHIVGSTNSTSSAIKVEANLLLGTNTCYWLNRLIGMVDEQMQNIAFDEKGTLLSRVKQTSIYRLATTEVKVFIEAYSSESVPLSFLTNCAQAIDSNTSRPIMLDYYRLLCKIVERAKVHELRKTLWDRNIRMPQKRFGQVKQLVLDCFRRYGRVLVLRIDFKYQAELAKDLTIEAMQEHLQEVMAAANARRGNFRDCLGYILRLEEGADSGFHCHAAFFFNGNKRVQDSVIAAQICKWWENHVTAGKGLAWNVNAYRHSKAEASKDESFAIGLVERKDEGKVVKLVEAMRYLCLAGQDVLYKPQRNLKTFHSKLLPIKEKRAVA